MNYLPVLLLMIVGLALGAILQLLPRLVRVGKRNYRKDQPFECGMPPVGDARHRFSVRFYLVAILFLLFDVEAVFFYPWAVVYRKYLSINSFILVEMAFFVAILLVGYYYVLRKGALEWE
ncbi:MAG: NADH-quinone oxidoreductase subunit A [Bdellovibrionota bacterium]